MRIAARSEGVPVLRDETLEFLVCQIKRFNPRKILEIGTATGCSGIAMLLGAPDARLTTVEIDEKSYLAARENFRKLGLEDRTTCFLGDAGDVVPKLSGSFDFIFLDGPKGHYLEYYPYLKDLLSEKGVMFCDNVLFRGYVVNRPEGRKFNAIINNMRKFILAVQSDAEMECELTEIGDGVLIARKKQSES